MMKPTDQHYEEAADFSRRVDFAKKVAGYAVYRGLGYEMLRDAELLPAGYYPADDSARNIITQCGWSVRDTQDLLYDFMESHKGGRDLKAFLCAAFAKNPDLLEQMVGALGMELGSSIKFGDLRRKVKEKKL
ncbi:MAG TPA: hypothetical protein VM120_01250 [Bryobacteraceae bacterium]|nr:hypothetical protein [Bryobacteraceae bacterium]